MFNHIENTKRIAKNTIFLYFRMLVMMAVSLFTFRELLKLLGVEDYGTYNVVGGVVILFSFLSNAMTNSNQRFLSFHIGKGDVVLLKRTFSMIINVQFIIALGIIILAETLGLWFINYRMNFAHQNMATVNWVYQFSILTFIIQILQIPYTSSIISHERMAFFSYASIGEAFLRLGVVLSLGLFRSNRLLIYSLLLSISSLTIYLIYKGYCNYSFRECKYIRFWNKKMFVKLTSFSTWNMIGGIGNVCAGQGINILFNIFGGVVVNAAMGVSHQVSAAVTSLVSNIQTAFNPQIIKSYATEDIEYFQSLIFRAARFSFILIYIFGAPIIICCNSVLHIWLTDVPEYAVPFTCITIAVCMADALSGPLWTGAQAIGDIKKYTLWLTAFTVLYLPISYIILKFGYSLVIVLIARIGLSIVLHVYRLIYLRRKQNFPSLNFFKQVSCRAFVLMIIMGAVIVIDISCNSFKLVSIWMIPMYLALFLLIAWPLMVTKSESRFVISHLLRKIEGN